jgi:molybdopterin converting factor small subunit
MSAQTHLPEVVVRLPHRLRDLAGGRAVAKVRGATVGDAINDLISQHPALRPRLRDAAGNLRTWMLYFLNDEDIRTKQGEQTPLTEGDVLAVVVVAEGG